MHVVKYSWNIFDICEILCVAICDAILCCAELWFTILCCAALRYVMLCYAMLCDARRHATFFSYAIAVLYLRLLASRSSLPLNAWFAL